MNEPRCHMLDTEHLHNLTQTDRVQHARCTRFKLIFKQTHTLKNSWNDGCKFVEVRLFHKTETEREREVIKLARESIFPWLNIRYTPLSRLWREKLSQQKKIFFSSSSFLSFFLFTFVDLFLRVSDYEQSARAKASSLELEGWSVSRSFIPWSRVFSVNHYKESTPNMTGS